MWKLVPLLVALTACPPAIAQSAEGNSRNFVVAQGSFNLPPRDDEAGYKNSECLVERRTGRLVCHRRAEWEKIAATIQKRVAK